MRTRRQSPPLSRPDCGWRAWTARAVRGVGVQVVLAMVGLSHLPTVYADEAAEARFYDEKARAYYNAGKYSKAAEAFFKVRRLVDNPRTFFNLGLCFEQLKRYDQAFFFFAQYLEAQDDGEQERTYAEQALSRLGKRVAQLRVNSQPPGAEVIVDVKEHGTYGRTPTVIPVSPGKHRLWIDKPGYRRRELTLVSRRGVETSTSVRLERIVGQLVVRTSSAARILVTDLVGGTLAESVGRLERPLAPGTYTIRVVAPGFHVFEGLGSVVENERTEIDVRLERLPPPRSVLTITSNQPGALVEIDGRPVGFAPALLDDIEVGDREIRISYEGLLPWSGSVEVPEERRGYLTASLTSPAETTRSPVTWVVGGVGAAMLVGALTTGILAIEADDELKEAQANPRDDVNARQIRDEGVALATATDVLLIGGLAAIATATILYFVTEEVQGQPSSASIAWD